MTEHPPLRQSRTVLYVVGGFLVAAAGGWLMQSTHLHAAFVSKTFGRWHGLGPVLYIERGGFMVHLWLRYFRLPYQHGWRWGYTLRVQDRSLLFGGRR